MWWLGWFLFLEIAGGGVEIGDMTGEGRRVLGVLMVVILVILVKREGIISRLDRWGEWSDMVVLVGVAQCCWLVWW